MSIPSIPSYATTLTTAQQAEQTQNTMQIIQSGNSTSTETTLAEEFSKAGVPQDSSSNAAIQDLVHLFMNITGSEPDNKERSQYLQSVIQQTVATFHDHCKRYCQQANVGSMQEFIEKSNRIKALRDEACEKNTRSAEFIAKSIQLDEEMVKAGNQGTITTAQSTTIRQYWELVAKEGFSVLQAVFARFESVQSDTNEWLKKSSVSVEQNRSAGNARSELLSQAEVLSKNLMVAQSEVVQNLLKQLTSVTSDSDRKQIEYLVLKANNQVPPIFKKNLRMKIQAFADENNKLRKIEAEAEVTRRQRAQKCFESLYNESLNDYRNRITDAQSETDKKRLEDELTEAKKDLEGRSANLNIRTIEQVVDDRCASTQSILAWMPLETEHERNFVQLLQNTQEVQLIDSNDLVIPEMRGDLTALSVDHFVRKEMQALEARLTAFIKLNQDYAASRMAGRIQVVTT